MLFPNSMIISTKEVNPPILNSAASTPQDSELTKLVRKLKHADAKDRLQILNRTRHENPELLKEIAFISNIIQFKECSIYLNEMFHGNVSKYIFITDPSTMGDFLDCYMLTTIKRLRFKNYFPFLHIKILEKLTKLPQELTSSYKHAIKHMEEMIIEIRNKPTQKEEADKKLIKAIKILIESISFEEQALEIIEATESIQEKASLSIPMQQTELSEKKQELEELLTSETQDAEFPTISETIERIKQLKIEAQRRIPKLQNHISVIEKQIVNYRIQAIGYKKELHTFIASLRDLIKKNTPDRLAEVGFTPLDTSIILNDIDKIQKMLNALNTTHPFILAHNLRCLSIYNHQLKNLNSQLRLRLDDKGKTKEIILENFNPIYSVDKGLEKPRKLLIYIAGPGRGVWNYRNVKHSFEVLEKLFDFSILFEGNILDQDLTEEHVDKIYKLATKIIQDSSQEFELCFTYLDCHGSKDPQTEFTKARDLLLIKLSKNSIKNLVMCINSSYSGQYMSDIALPENATLITTTSPNNPATSHMDSFANCLKLFKTQQHISFESLILILLNIKNEPEILPFNDSNTATISGAFLNDQMLDKVPFREIANPMNDYLTPNLLKQYLDLVAINNENLFTMLIGISSITNIIEDLVAFHSSEQDTQSKNEDEIKYTLFIDEEPQQDKQSPATYLAQVDESTVYHTPSCAIL